MGLGNLVAVGGASHATHYTEHVVVNSVYTDLGGVGARYSAGRKDKLKDSVVNSGEVAAARGLVFLRAESKGVYVDTSVGGASVVLVGLDNVEVGTLTLGEAVLAVELQLGSYNRVLTPAVHVKGSLGKNECSGIRESRTMDGRTIPCCGASISISSSISARGTVSLEKTSGVKESLSSRCGISRAEGMDGIGEGINGISVVEGLGTKGLVKSLTALKRSAVIYVGIRLDNPYQLLTGVVEVQLNLVGRGTNRFVTSELYLLDQVFVGVLCHLAALIGVKEDVVNIQGSGYKGLLVSSAYGLCAIEGSKVLYGPEALTNGAEVNVNLDLVVLEGDKGKGKTRVAAEPELKGYVKGGLGEGVAGSAYLGGSTLGSAGSRYVSESGVSDVC
jgi:hypothetical protein